MTGTDKPEEYFVMYTTASSDPTFTVNVDSTKVPHLYTKRVWRSTPTNPWMADPAQRLTQSTEREFNAQIMRFDGGMLAGWKRWTRTAPPAALPVTESFQLARLDGTGKIIAGPQEFPSSFYPMHDTGTSALVETFFLYPSGDLGWWSASLTTRTLYVVRAARCE
jgi:hypothetical protein